MNYKGAFDGGWVVYLLPATAKIVVGTYAISKGYINPQTGASRDLFTSTTIRRFDNLIGGMIPDFPDYFREHANDGRKMGEALVHRARHTVLKNELVRFQRPAFQPLHDLVTARLNNERQPIRLEELYEAQELVYRAALEGEPGVYFRGHPGDNRIYVGEGKRAAERGTRTDGTDYCLSVLVTEGQSGHKALESALMESLSEFRVEGRRNRSQLVFPRGTDALAKVRAHVEEHYRPFLKRACWSMGDV